MLGEWAWPVPEGRDFEDRDEMREAWQAHGDRLTREYRREHPGERPAAWWAWTRPDLDPTHRSDRTAVLREEGLLTDEEIDALNRKTTN
jgi:hypothetical protein